MGVVTEQDTQTNFYLKPEKSWDGIDPYYLCEMEKTMGEEESKNFDFILKTLFSFDQWLEKIACGPTFTSSFSLEPEVLPRRYGSEPSYPPALPPLEAILSFASMSLDEYTHYKIGGNHQEASLSGQICFAIGNLLNLIQRMGTKRVHWKNASWERTSDGYNVYKDTVFAPLNLYQIYYTPGRNRFGIVWQDSNPYSSSPKPEVTVSEVRFEPERLSSDQGKLKIDFSVRQYSQLRGKKSLFSGREAVELTDFIFGTNRHHILIGIGSYSECVSFVAETMRSLNVSHLIKTPDDIPSR